MPSVLEAFATVPVLFDAQPLFNTQGEFESPDGEKRTSSINQNTLYARWDPRGSVVSIDAQDSTMLRH